VLANGRTAAHIDAMDDPKIRLFTDGKSNGVSAWTWELLLEGKRVAVGKSPGTQETAFAAARAALAKERKRRSDHE
jgi:hypothetical protein